MKYIYFLCGVMAGINIFAFILWYGGILQFVSGWDILLCNMFGGTYTLTILILDNLTKLQEANQI